MKKMGFVINGARCNGCGACLVACKVEHGITETGTWLRTRYENRATQALLTMGCNHCDEPACMKICPVKAYSKDDDGLVCYATKYDPAKRQEMTHLRAR